MGDSGPAACAICPFVLSRSPGPPGAARDSSGGAARRRVMMEVGVSCRTGTDDNRSQPGSESTVTTEPAAEGARIWGGTTLDERRAARRRKLVETGLDL